MSSKDYIYCYQGSALRVAGSTAVIGNNFERLEPRTMRFDFKYDQFNPITDLADLSEDGLIWTHLYDDVYDFHYDNSNWGYRKLSISSGGLFNVYAYKKGSGTIWPMAQHKFDILDMDMRGVTNASYLFNSARQVQNIFSIRNTSSVTDFSYFIGHTSRTFAIDSIPLFDTSSATNMFRMFEGCINLTTVPLFNTSHVTIMEEMFKGCSSLVSVPLFDTSSCTNMSSMFRICYNVQSGALALYQQASTQANVPSHTSTFYNCGRDTVTGAAELAQIPSSWRSAKT